MGVKTAENDIGEKGEKVRSCHILELEVPPPRVTSTKSEACHCECNLAHPSDARHH